MTTTQFLPNSKPRIKSLFVLLTIFISIFNSELKAQCTPPDINSYTCANSFCENTSYCNNQTTWFTVSLNGTASGVKIYDNSAGTGTPIATFTGSSTFYSGYIPIPSTTSDYYVFVLGSGGCQASRSNSNYTITINGRPSSVPTGVTASPSSVCSGSDVTLSANSPSGNLEIKWATTQLCGIGSSMGGEISGTSTSYTETNYTSSDVTETMYGYYYDPTTQCRGEAVPVSYTVKKDFLNCSGILSSTAVNTYSNVTYSASAPSGASYLWNFGSGASPSTSTSSTGNVQWTSGGSKTVTLTSTYNGCTEECSDVVEVTQPCPTATIISVNSNCVSTNTSFTADYMGAGVTYTWSFGSGASPSSATGIGPHTVTYSTTGTKTVGLTVTKSGCSSNFTSKSVSIGNNFTTPTITGPRSLNENTNGNFSVTTVSGSTYTWLLDGGTQSGSGNSIDILWSTTGNKIITATVNNGYCEKSDTHLVVITTGQCYASKTRYTAYNLNTNMNNVVYTDNAGTTATHTISSTPTAFKTSINISRSGDTGIYWQQTKTTTARTMTLTLSSAVEDLSFTIRDLDRHGSSTHADSVNVKFYDANNSLISNNYVTATRGAYVGVSANNTYYSNINSSPYTIDDNLTTGDITFEVSVPVKKFEIIRRQNSTSSVNLDLAISEIEWCSNAAPLPVTFLSTSASLWDNNKVKINWSTASEINNSHFNIEKSTDGRKFTPIGTISGAGNSNKIMRYEFIDNELNSNALYRIKQVDFDGKFAYSTIVTIQSNKLTSRLSAQVYPNPSQSEINLFIENANKKEEMEVRILDSKGQLVYQNSIKDVNQLDAKTISVAEFNKGMYFIQVITKSDVKVISFVKI